jgi:hypothetical protein
MATNTGTAKQSWDSGLYNCTSDWCAAANVRGRSLLHRAASGGCKGLWNLPTPAAHDSKLDCCCRSSCCYGTWCLPCLYGENTSNLHGGGCFGPCCLYYW